MGQTVKSLIKAAKLSVLWVRRILLASNHFKVNPIVKLRMNICGGYLADQYVI